VAVLANFILFQLGWFACVLGASSALPWAGTGIALLIVGWHLSRAAQPRRELVLILAAGAVGLFFETLLISSGTVHYPHGVLPGGLAPHWMVALWMLFATTLNLSLAWLKRRVALAAVLGAIGGPLAYAGGAKLGALVFVHEATGLLAIGAGWALLTPLLILLARRLDGFSPALAGMESRHG